MAEVHDHDPTRPEGDRWILREHDEPAAPGSNLRVGVDIGEPSTAQGIDPTSDSFHALDEWGGQPAKRRVQVYVGGIDKLGEILKSADRVKWWGMRKNLEWADRFLRSVGMEIAVLRDAGEDD
jgi:hypothetical protein